jgi:DHA1 family bicyclomycin/chloramphenicol resistance-like MFS transporter
MCIGGLSGGVVFTFLNSASVVMIGGFNLSEKIFGFIFGLNGIGIILLSLLNKALIKIKSVKSILLIGLVIQAFGVVFLGVGGVFSLKIIVIISIFIIVSSMGLVGPNSLVLAMKNQKNRAGAASAMMGSMHFFCGLISGILLNFIFFNALINMFFTMSCFISLVLILYIYNFNEI